MNIETAFAPLLDTLAKGSALILIGTALIATLRKTSAANRHTVSTAIFAALLLLPLTKLVPARWSFALEKPAAPTANVRLPLSAPLQGSGERAAAQPAENVAQPAPRAPFVIPWKKLSVAVWLVGAMLLLARRTLIALRLRSIVRLSVPIEDERFAAKVHSLVDSDGVRAEVRQSDLCRVPLASGIVRPVVLLPVEAADWSDAYIFSALRHELGHIRRRDCVTRLLADVLCTFYWVNPLVWFAARQMRLAQEQACDDLVLNAGAPADEYAEQLVEVVRSLQSDCFTARHALAMAQPSTLETRVIAIVDTQRDRSARSVRGTLAGCAFVATMLALCTAAQLRGADEKKAVSAGNVPAPVRQQVEIEAKFIEITGDDPLLPDVLKTVNQKGASVTGILVQGEIAKVLKAMREVKGVDLVSSPRITTLVKQPAMIEIGRELRYPTAWDQDAKTGALKPTKFETKNVGVSLSVETDVEADGAIDLQLTPEIVEFAGWRDLDGDAKGVVGKPDASKPLSERLTAAPNMAEVPETHRKQPVFKTRRMTTAVTVRPEQTILLGGLLPENGEDNAKPADKEPQRRLVVLVTARIAKPGGIPVEKRAGIPENPDGKAGAVTEPKPLQIVSDATTLDKKTGTLSASGNVRIETAQATIRAVAAEITPKDNAAAAPAETPNAGAAKPDTRWILPSVEFRDATVREIVDFLVTTSKTLDAAGTGANIILKDAEKIAEVRVTLSLKEIPLAEVLRYVAALSNCELVKEQFAFVIRPMPPGKVPAPNADQEKGAPNLPPAPAPAEPKSAALKKAGTIIFPKLDLRDATLSETVDFLREKAKDLDPDKQGVNLLLKLAAGAQEPKLTLSLANIPLSEALRYVAALSGFEIVADEHIITIRPVAK